MLRHALALAAALPLGIAACGDIEASADSSETPVAVATQASADDLAIDPCNASRATKFIGDEASEEARGELAIAVMPIETVRWVAPGEATTDDLDPHRLNVMLDVDNKIESVGCG